MEQRLDMVRAVEVYGITATEAAQLWGVSRDTWHKWRRRFEDEGVAGLADRSTRPLHSPLRMPGRVEVEIVALRTAHPRWGPRRLRAELTRRGLSAPAASTIQTALERNGLKRVPPPPKPPTIRFERSQANELWQMDGKEWALKDGTKVSILSVIDDRSRYLAAIGAVLGDFEGGDAIAVFDAAVSDAGPPASVLTDRGSQFTGKRTKAVSAFERHVWATGAYTLNGRGYHPQTQGKVERFHRTLAEWLDDNGPFETIQALNDGLAVFRHHYNVERPHQSLNDNTPHEVWSSADRAEPDPQVNAHRLRRESLRSTRANGNLSYGEWTIGLGTAWSHTKVSVVDLGNLIEIYAGDELIRAVEPDHTKTYLGTGRRPTGRPPRQLR